MQILFPIRDIWELTGLVILYTVVMVVAGWIWGDRKKLDECYPTILYMVILSLLHNLLTIHHPLWFFQSIILPHHTLINLVITFIQFPALVLIFFTHLPSTNFRRFLYFLLWTAIFTSIELISLPLDLIVYKNGWSLWWSIFLNLLTFPMLYLHSRRPLVAWAVSLPIILFFILVFRVPLIDLP